MVNIQIIKRVGVGTGVKDKIKEDGKNFRLDLELKFKYKNI